MEENNRGYMIFQIIFNIIVLLVAIGIVVSYSLTYKEEPELMYIILGVIIGSGCIIRLFKIFFEKNKTQNS